MNIVTHCLCPPIPTRQFDYSAYDADTYDGENGPVGYGPTEEAAIADLMMWMEDGQ